MADELSQPNVQDMTAIVWDEIRKIRSGETTPSNVNAIVNGTRAILAVVKAQMEYAKQTGAKPEIPMLLLAAPDEKKVP